MFQTLDFCLGSCYYYKVIKDVPMSLPTKQQVFETVTTTVLTVVAVVYTAGKRLGEAYFAQQDVVNEDLATFGRAVVTGTRNAVGATYRLGQEVRVEFDVLYPVVQPKVVALYNSVKVQHNKVSDYLRNKLNNN